MPSRILRLWNPDAGGPGVGAWEEVGDSRLTTHLAAADPHGGYLLETLADAKGDLLAASAADTVGRLALGTDGQVLTADSAQTLGVRWATPAAGLTDPTTATGDLLVKTGVGTADLVPTSTTMAHTTGDGNAYTFGLEFSTTSALPVAAIAWYRSGTDDITPSTLAIWDTTTSGAVVTIATGITDSGAVGWQSTPLPAAFTTVAGRHYRVTQLHASPGNYGTVSGTLTPDSGVTFHASGAGGGYYVITTANTYPATGTAVRPGVSVRCTSGTGTLARLPVGSNDQVLTADSAQSLGVKWGAVPGLSGYLPLAGGTLTGDLVLSEATPTLALKLTADTQPRSRLTDTALAFGPGGATAPDATLARTGAGALRVDSNLGVGVNPAAWHPDRRAVQVGQTASLVGHPTSNYLEVAENTYLDAGATQRAIVAGAASRYYLSGGGLTVATAPAVAAGAAQTLTVRAVIDTNGTLTLTPAAAQNAVTYPGRIALQEGAGANGRIAALGAGGALEVYGASHSPWADNGMSSGAPGLRWSTVYAVAGTINTCSRAYKEGITPLDPAACAQAVLDTDWCAFEYTPPPLPPGPPGETPAQSSARVSAHSRMVQENAFARKQKGYVLGSPSHRISPLFGLSDRQSASPQADLAVVACALQDALTRLAALEGASAA